MLRVCAMRMHSEVLVIQALKAIFFFRAAVVVGHFTSVHRKLQ
jgi:hypothetical protein